MTTTALIRCGTGTPANPRGLCSTWNTDSSSLPWLRTQLESFWDKGYRDFLLWLPGDAQPSQHPRLLQMDCLTHRQTRSLQEGISWLRQQPEPCTIGVSLGSPTAPTDESPLTEEMHRWVSDMDIDWFFFAGLSRHLNHVPLVQMIANRLGVSLIAGSTVPLVDNHGEIDVDIRRLSGIRWAARYNGFYRQKVPVANHDTRLWEDSNIRPFGPGYDPFGSWDVSDLPEKSRIGVTFLSKTPSNIVTNFQHRGFWIINAHRQLARTTESIRNLYPD